MGDISEKQISSPLAGGTISTETFCEKFSSSTPLRKPEARRPLGLWMRGLLV